MIRSFVIEVVLELFNDPRTLKKLVRQLWPNLVSYVEENPEDMADLLVIVFKKLPPKKQKRVFEAFYGKKDWRILQEIINEKKNGGGCCGAS